VVFDAVDVISTTILMNSTIAKNVACGFEYAVIIPIGMVLFQHGGLPDQFNRNSGVHHHRRLRHRIHSVTAHCKQRLALDDTSNL
jgi:hypothetical protein